MLKYKGGTHTGANDMSAYDFRSEIEELREVLGAFRNELSKGRQRKAQLEPPLRTLLVSRVVRAIDEGMAILETECSRRTLAAHAPDDRARRTSVLEGIERDLDREEHPLLRWLLVAYGLALCNFDFISSNIEPLAASDLDELTWLVCGALWVQWESGQPMAHQLKATLSRLQARHPGFDEHFSALAAGPRSVAQETALLIKRLLADPTATLPEPGAPSDGK